VPQRDSDMDSPLGDFPLQILVVEVKKWHAQESRMERGLISRARAAPMEVDIATPLADEENRRRQAEEYRSQKGQGQQKGGERRWSAPPRGEGPWWVKSDRPERSRREQEMHDAWDPPRQAWGIEGYQEWGRAGYPRDPPDDPGAASSTGARGAQGAAVEPKQEERQDRGDTWGW
jgi:hypothetical protein